MRKKVKQNRNKFSFLCIFLLFLSFFSIAQAKTPSLVGLWKTSKSEKNNKPSSFIKVWIEKSELKGAVAKLKPKRGQEQKYDDLTIGKTILWGMRGQGRKWSGGRVLDPRNGTVYHANVSVSTDGKELYLRGYVGVPMFGRTTTWYRVA